MNILILGSGGREHALAWKIKQSTLCSQLFVAPGNAGTATLAENVAIDVNDFEAQKAFCLANNIELIVVGPEDPLVNGIVDFFEQQKDIHVHVVGPSAEGAQLEGSKAFSKKFMERHRIPTASYAEFDVSTYEEGKAYIANHTLPVVLKADGLAAGKGVVIAQTQEDALKSFEEMIIGQQFGKASSKVVVETFLAGIEASVFVLTDGKDYKLIGHAKDYKRIGEGDKGLNTGGMGCVTPVPFVQGDFLNKVIQRIIEPTIQGLATENISYKGFIFFGLINVQGEPYVIEYNARMGDPETEVVMPSLQSDLVPLLCSLFNGTLSAQSVTIDNRSLATVVAVSRGYPGNYEKGKLISLPNSTAGDSIIFHAGTKQVDDKVLSNGGRVLTVTSYGETIKQAVEKSAEVLKDIHFDNMYFRKDIGYEFD